ncbi:MAG: folylpolyglutamate synthase/dihydrofolate synthase family protein [Alcanivorax sp.]|nr:folylpolyglutamate synthase/dihydrofolate synthase family protein [Alcanivorax sp.]
MTDADSLLARWLARIEAMHPAEIELGLDRVRQVAERLGVLTLPMPVITVAGTNGKGSTVRLMQALAQQGGRQVCVYTSPHLHHFNERIVLPSGQASDRALCVAFDAVEQARGEIGLTYFEFTTLAALWLFSRSNADLVILEVGLGGRLDATNVVEPSVAVVTSVGLDHQDWLGHDRETIAMEKAGIARAGLALVYGETDWPANLEQLAEQHDAQAVFAGRDFVIRDGELLLHSGTRLELPQSVALGHDNLATACQALSLLDMGIRCADLQAVAALTLPGRCEAFQQGIARGWLDVGHNVAAVGRFLARLPECQGIRHVVFGMMADKPIAEVMALFNGQPVRWYLAAPAIGRAASAEQLADLLPAQAEFSCHDRVGRALAAATAAAVEQDQVLVLGSFFTVAEARQALQENV